jgi:hypothetical protein
MNFPPPPAVPAAQSSKGTYPLRFEDLSQDGRVHMGPIVASIGAAIWEPMLWREPSVMSLHQAGIRPIFTRLVLEVGSAQLELGTKLAAEGVYELAHEPDGKGAAARLFLNMWTNVWAEPDKRRAERAFVGRLFAEHQLTRPHAPPEERRVKELPGLPLPSSIYRAAKGDSLLELEPGAEWIEPEARLDAAPAVFGLSHTDSNRHTNSLVYPRLFGEAALRRFAELGVSTKTLPVRLHISFRKPFFAGDRAEIRLRAFRADGQHGAVGTFSAPPRAGSNAASPPHVYVDLRFSETP